MFQFLICKRPTDRSLIINDLYDFLCFFPSLGLSTPLVGVAGSYMLVKTFGLACRGTPSVSFISSSISEWTLGEQQGEAGAGRVDSSTGIWSYPLSLEIYS